MHHINKNSLKKFIIVSVFVLASLIGTQKALATTSDVSGWAWASNIGWISFNSKDTGAGGGPYAVTVSTTTTSTLGTFGGYAWSPNVGWIKFGGLSGYPGSTGTIEGLALNGSSQYVTTASNVLTGLNAFTMCAWVKYDGSGNKYLISSQPQSSPTHNGSVESSIGGTVALIVYNSGSGADYDYYTASKTPTTNVWTHVCSQWDSSHTMSVYFDGTKDTGTYTTGGSKPTTVTGAYPLNIGRGAIAGGIYKYFGGNVAEVRIYNRVLTGGEISTLYGLGKNAGNGGTTNGLVAHWPLTEISGTVAPDTSGNNKNGTLVGSPSWANTASTLDENAKVDFSNGAVTGWIRACAGTIDGKCTSMTSRSDGWDGWISLSGPVNSSPNTSGYQGTSTLGVTLGIDKLKLASYGKLSGYAWGSDVVGWINFGAISTIGGGTIPNTGVNFCSLFPCGVDQNTVAFNISASSVVLSRQVGASALPGILVSGGTSGDQTVTVSIDSANFTDPHPGVSVTLLDGNGVGASSVACSITGSNPSCSLAKVRVAITDASTAPNSFTIPIIGTSNGKTLTALMNISITGALGSNLNLWAVKALPSGGYDTVTKYPSITIKEGALANIAWQTAGVDAGTCRGFSIGINDSSALSAWKGTQAESQDSGSPFTISGLTKGQYGLKLTCSKDGIEKDTDSVSIKVIKSDESEF